MTCEKDPDRLYVKDPFPSGLSKSKKAGGMTDNKLALIAAVCVFFLQQSAQGLDDTPNSESFKVTSASLNLLSEESLH